MSEFDLIRALAADADAERVRRAVRDVSFEALATTMLRLRLLGLLGTRLLDHGVVEVPDNFRRQVEWIVRSGRREGLHMQMLTWKLLQALEQREIPAMPLKGPFLAERLHGDPGLRLSADIDLLVAADDMHRAVEVIEAQGYVRPRIDDELPNRLHHIFEAENTPPVELHWRITWYETRYSRHMLARATQEGGLRIPSPADELVSLLLWHAREGLIGLRYAVDVAAWWGRFGDGPEVATAARVISEHPAIQRAAAAGALGVQQTLGLPIATALDLPATRGVLAAVRLSDWGAVRPEPEADAVAKIVDGLVTAPGGIPAWIKRVGIPTLPGHGLTRVRDQMAYTVALVRSAAPFYWRLATRRQRVLEPTCAASKSVSADESS